MTPEHEKALRKLYPLFFGQAFLNDEPFRCGDGWYALLRSVAEIVEMVLASQPSEVRYRYRAVQVKEKFGELRIYLDHEPHEGIVRALIDWATQQSKTICDVCGEPGKPSTVNERGLMATRCPTHEKG
jgi:hypothetical protein